MWDVEGGQEGRREGGKVERKVPNFFFIDASYSTLIDVILSLPVYCPCVL